MGFFTVPLEVLCESWDSELCFGSIQCPTQIDLQISREVENCNGHTQNDENYNFSHSSR